MDLFERINQQQQSNDNIQSQLVSPEIMQNIQRTTVPQFQVDLTPSEQAIVTQRMSMSDNPDEEKEKWEQAILMSRQYNVPLEYAIDNLEAMVKYQTGVKPQFTQTFTRALMNSWEIGEKTVERATLTKEYYHAFKNGEDTTEIESKIAEMDAQISEMYDYTPRKWYQEILKGAAQSLPYTLDIAAVSTVGAVAGNVIAPGVGTALSIVGSFAEGYRLTKYSAYYDMVKAGVTPSAAEWTSTLSGGIQAAIESVLGIEAGLGRALAGGSANFVTKLMKNMYLNGTFNTIGLFATKYLTNVASEGIEEFLQEITDKAFTNMAYTQSGMETPYSASQVMKDAVNAGVQGAGVALILGGAGTIVETVTDVNYAKAMRQDALTTSSKQVFIEKHMEDEQLETIGNQKRREALAQTYDNINAQYEEAIEGLSTAEARTVDVDTIEQPENVNMEDEEGNIVEPKTSKELPELKRMDNGRLRVQEATNVVQMSDGSERHQLLVGSNDGTSNRYGTVTYTLNEDGSIEINNVKTRAGYQSITADAIQELARRYPGQTITWDPETETQQKIKQSILDNSPNGQLNYYESNTDVQERAQLAEKIGKAFTNLNRDERNVAAVLTQLRAQAKGMTANEYMDKYISGMESGDLEKGKLGRTIIKGAKAVITAGQSANFSTFAHESFHVIRNEMSEEENKRLADAFKEAVNTDSFKKFVAASRKVLQMDYNTIRSQIEAMDGKNWNEAQEEIAARMFESYLLNGKTTNTKLADLFSKIAEFFRKIYGLLRGQRMLNDNIIKAYDSLFEKSAEAQTVNENVSEGETVLNQTQAEAEQEYAEVEAKYKGTDQWMKAPNGNPTNLTERQWVQVRTPSFKKWFGDWENDPANASKVVDENGEPLVMYHGTLEDFDIFEIDRSGKNWHGYTSEGRGFYFTSSIENAERWAEDANRRIPKEQRPDAILVVPTFLNIRNPYGKNINASDFIYGEKAWNDLTSARTSLADYGHDGNFREWGGNYEAVAVSPTQIKSATDNVGTFSNENPNIFYQTESEGEVPDVQTRINQSMTMSQFEDMVDRTFKIEEIEGYKDWREWLDDMGSSVIALSLDNEYDIYRKFLRKLESIGLGEDFSTEDIINAYLNGTLTGTQKTASVSQSKIDLSEGSSYTGTKFYEPQVSTQDARNLLAKASTKITKANKSEVMKARADFVTMAHNPGFSDSVGISQSEINKKLRSWAAYPTNAKDLSVRLNYNVAEQNRWTGIENSNLLKSWTVSKDDVLNMVKDVEGKGSEIQFHYLVSSMLALDTHIDYSPLTIQFNAGTIKSSNKANSFALGDYSQATKTIRISRDSLNTVAHELGHYIDNKWGSEVSGFDQYLTENMMTHPDEKVQSWINHFNSFLEKIEGSSSRYDAYHLRATETFARFVANFVEWTRNVAGDKWAVESSHYHGDHFNSSQYVEFVRILQEKAYLDSHGLLNKNTSVFYQTEDENESLMSDAKDMDLDDFLDFGEFMYDDYTEAQLRQIWNRAHGKTTDGQKQTGPAITEDMTDEQKDEEFIRYFESDDALRSLIEKLRSAYSLRRDVNNRGIGAETEEEYNEIMRDLETFDRFMREASPFFKNIISGTGTVSDTSLKNIRTTMENAPRMYRDLYAEITGDDSLRADVYDKYLPNIDEPGFEELKGMSIADRKKLSEKIENKTLKEKLLSGKETLNGEAEKVIKSMDDEIAKLEDDLKQMQAKNNEYYNAFNADEKRIVKLNEELADAKHQLDDYNRKIRLKMDKGSRISPKAITARNTIQEKIDLLNEQLKTLRATDRTKAAEQRRQAIADLKKEIREKQNARREAKKVHDYKLKLASAITREVSNAVDYEYRQKIMAIQALVDPNFRQNTIWFEGKRYTLEEFRNYFRSLFDGVSEEELNEEIRNGYEAFGLTKKQADRLVQKNLNDFTVSELEEMAQQVSDLADEGRQVWQAKQDEKRRQARRLQNQIISGIMSRPKAKTPDEMPTPGSAEDKKAQKNVRKQLRTAWFKTLNMDRKAQMLDNDEKGVAYDLLIRERRKVQSNESKAKSARINPVMDLMKQLNVNPQDLYQTVDIVLNGKTEKFTYCDLFYGLAAQRDEMNYRAFAYGTLVTIGEKEQLNHDNDLIEALGFAKNKQFVQQAEAAFAQKPDYVKVFQAMENDLQSHSGAMAEFSIREYNDVPSFQDYYLPIYRADFNGTKLAAQLSEDVQRQNPGKNASLPSMSRWKERIDISANNQRPVHLDYFSTWLETVEEVEHTIATLGYERDLKRVFQNFGSETLKSYIDANFGRGMLKDIDNYINEVGNPPIYNDVQGTEKTIRSLRGNLYSAYLGFKASGIVLQAITSPAPTLGYVNPFSLAKNLLKMTFEFRKTWDFVSGMSEFMKNRSMDPALDIVKKEANNYTDPKLKRDYANFLEKGTMGLEVIDKWAVTASWMALYEKKLNEFEFQNDADSMRKAAEYADEIIAETQPLADPLELAPLFKGRSEWAKAFMQFTTSMNVIWNNVTYDIIGQARKKGTFRRNVGMLFGYALAGAILGAVQNGTGDDDEPEDKVRQFLYNMTTQFTGSVPVFGTALDQLAEGVITGEASQFYGTNSIFPGIEDTLKGLTKLGESFSEEDEDKRKKKIETALKNMTKGVGLLAGVPTSALNELKKTFVDEEGFTFNPAALAGRREK